MPSGIIDHIIEIGNVLFLHELAQNIDVAIGFGVGGKDVVVRNDDDSIAIPNLGGFAKFPLKNTYGARPADVMGHQYIRLDPNVVPGLYLGFARGPREDLFAQRHRTNSLTDAGERRKARFGIQAVTSVGCLRFPKGSSVTETI